VFPIPRCHGTRAGRFDCRDESPADCGRSVRPLTPAVLSGFWRESWMLVRVAGGVDEPPLSGFSE
jgi:hypothetical protein